jgi:Flp pilus assembly protein TadG
MARRTAHRRAAEAIEFALVFPVFLLLVMSTIEFLWFMSTSSALQTSVRTGARLGAVAISGDAATDAEVGAEAAWSAFGTPSPATFDAIEEGESPNLQLRVTGTVAYASLTGLVPPMVLPAAMTKRVTVRLEDQLP